MSKKTKFALTILSCIGFAVVVYLFRQGGLIAVLEPKGWIAVKERNLLAAATFLMLIVVLPVIFLTIFFAWKYRESNKKAKYTPDWDHNHVAEIIWWSIPFGIVLVLAIVAWNSSHELDPYKPIEGEKKPLTIQVVALRWKWLFIYPEQKIATVNFFQFPEKTPLNFEITAHAPMNSFWIPQLGGQIYAMPGMRTKLHLIAHEVGRFRGSSANLSGKGFAGMTFFAESSSEADFDRWVESCKGSPSLTLEEYHKLAKGSENNPIASFALKQEDLFERIVMRCLEN